MFKYIQTKYVFNVCQYMGGGGGPHKFLISFSEFWLLGGEVFRKYIIF